MKMKILALALAISATGLGVGRAQRSAAAPAKSAAAAMVDPAKSFDEMLSRFEKDTMGLAKEMPAEKYDFAPGPSVFAPGQTPQFTGVSTFSAMIAHLTQGNYFYGGMVSGLKPDVDMEAIAKVKDKDKLVAGLAASFVFAHKAIATLTAQNAFESVTGNQTRATMAAMLVAHGYDHYGQLVEYLRMNGGIPPASKH